MLRDHAHEFLARVTVGTSLYVWLRQSVSQCVRAFLFFLCLNNQASNCLIHFGGSSGAAQRKTTSDGGRPLTENDL